MRRQANTLIYGYRVRPFTSRSSEICALRSPLLMFVFCSLTKFCKKTYETCKSRKKQILQIFNDWRGESSIKTLRYENVKNATFHKTIVEKSNITTRLVRSTNRCTETLKSKHTVKTVHGNSLRWVIFRKSPLLEGSVLKCVATLDYSVNVAKYTLCDIALLSKRRMCTHSL
jgi:hypothetical protein